MEVAGIEAEPVTARGAGLLACTRCGRVWPARTRRCGTCGSVLYSRLPRSLQRVWGWWLAGAVCYVPANLYPMLRTRTLFTTQEDTIIAGAIELLTHGSPGIALVILVASVAIPIGKFIAIAYLALTLGGRTWLTSHRQQQLYEVVEFIGRWSMIDVFVVAVLSSLVQLNVVASINPGPAALTFALSVIFTMLSAQSFDSRMIWDGPRARA